MREYIPSLPFESYKWLFATKQPTESLGDPAVLLGLVTRLSRIANGSNKYSGDAFAEAVQKLDRDISTSVNLSSRVGPRNLMRNSGQYWKSFGLIPRTDRSGIIELTPLAVGIAKGEISQVDFAAATILTFKIPNPTNYSAHQIQMWDSCDLSIHPFKLILQIVRELKALGEGWITNDELFHVVVPMAGDKQKPEMIAKFVHNYRSDPGFTSKWPSSSKGANDIRFTGEYLRFLANFGYLDKQTSSSRMSYLEEISSSLDRDHTRYEYVNDIDYQIDELLSGQWSEESPNLLNLIRQSDISSTVTLAASLRSNSRPQQQQFRHNLLENIPRCPITGVTVREVLQAAHIKPHAYGGPEEMDNGLPLRADIHNLFDAGLLLLIPYTNGERLCTIELANDLVRSNYRELIDKVIRVPEITNMDYLRWRSDNYLLGV